MAVVDAVALARARIACISVARSDSVGCFLLRSTKVLKATTSTAVLSPKARFVGCNDVGTISRGILPKSTSTS